jgi:hypothetical protein
MRPQHLIGLLASATLVCLLLAGCNGSSSSDSKDSAANGNGSAVKVEFPDGDPSVSAEDGGPEFTGEGWTTVAPYAMGDPKAVRGGAISTYIREWPGNLRMAGTGYNTWLNYAIRDLDVDWERFYRLAAYVNPEFEGLDDIRLAGELWFVRHHQRNAFMNFERLSERFERLLETQNIGSATQP